MDGIKGLRVRYGFTKGHLEPRDVSRLLDAAYAKSIRDWAMISVMCRAMLRTIEISRLDVSDYTWKNGRRILRVWGKGHDAKDGEVIVSDKLRGVLEEYITTMGAVTPSTPLFPAASNHGRGERMTTRNIRRIVQQHLHSIGIDDPAITAHSLRHTGAVWLLQSGADLVDVQASLRHASVRTTEIYVESIREQRRYERCVENNLDAIY